VVQYTRPLLAVRRLLVVLLFANLLGIAFPLFNLLGGGSTQTTLPVYPDGPVTLPAGLHAGTIGALVSNPSLAQNLLSLLSNGFTTALLALPMVIFARRLLERAASHHPFTAETVTGLRRLGILILIGGALAEVLRIGGTMALYVSAVPGANPLDLDLAPDGWWLLVGLTVLAFGQIVEHGRTLRAELDEVI
jgi:hypothetical protein